MICINPYTCIGHGVYLRFLTRKALSNAKLPFCVKSTFSSGEHHAGRLQTDKGRIPAGTCTHLSQ